MCGGKKSADTTSLGTIAAIVSVPLAPFCDPAAAAVTSEPPTPDETPGEWDIVVDGSGEGVEVEMDWDISVEGSGQGNSDASSALSAFTAVKDALDQVPVQKLTDDVLELQAFLTQVRCLLSLFHCIRMIWELKSNWLAVSRSELLILKTQDLACWSSCPLCLVGPCELLLSMCDESGKSVCVCVCLPDVVRQTDAAKLQSQLGKVNEVAALLKSPVLHRLIAIHTSERCSLTVFCTIRDHHTKCEFCAVKWL